MLLLALPQSILHGRRRKPVRRGTGADLTGLRILIVDDDQDFREVMAALLEARGAEVRKAPSGRKGLARAEKSEPDLVLLDQVMPDLQGIEVAQELRHRGIRAAIVLVSGVRQTAELVHDAPVEAWLMKPFSVDELVATIRQAMNRRDGLSEDPERGS